jgi:hypothetical protein
MMLRLMLPLSPGMRILCERIEVGRGTYSESMQVVVFPHINGLWFFNMNVSH